MIIKSVWKWEINIIFQILPILMILTSVILSSWDSSVKSKISWIVGWPWSNRVCVCCVCVSQKQTLVFGFWPWNFFLGFFVGTLLQIKNHTYWGLKNNWGVQSKNGLKICEGILCSSFSVKELVVIVHKKYFPCITILNFAHSVPHITSEPGGWGGN